VRRKPTDQGGNRIRSRDAPTQRIWEFGFGIAEFCVNSPRFSVNQSRSDGRI